MGGGPQGFLGVLVREDVHHTSWGTLAWYIEFFTGIPSRLRFGHAAEGLIRR